MTRTYFALLQGRPQVSVYEGDWVATDHSRLTSALNHIRLVKSHTFPMDQEDVVYIVRDGRNAMISHLYLRFLWKSHAFSRLSEINEALEHLCEIGHWWGDHLRKADTESQRRRLCIVRYEDLVAKPQSALTTMLSFMNVELPSGVLAECVRRGRAEPQYFTLPSSGYTYDPEPDSMYAALKRNRQGAYWREIFDERTKRWFHERGGTELLLRYGYEDSPDWWS